MFIIYIYTWYVYIYIQYTHYTYIYIYKYHNMIDIMYTIVCPQSGVHWVPPDVRHWINQVALVFFSSPFWVGQQLRVLMKSIILAYTREVHNTWFTNDYNMYIYICIYIYVYIQYVYIYI